MPTGYTDYIINKNYGFKEFALICARAMGATIMMRDEPLDTPIPEAFEPSRYYKESLEKARKRLAELEAMKPDERVAFGAAQIREIVEKYEQALARTNALNAKLAAVREQVEAWEPPTPDHVHFKNFMLDQIDMSKDNVDYWQMEMERAQQQAPLGLYEEAVKKARRDIVYHEKEHAEEVRRTNTRNEWIKALRESLDSVPA